MSVDSVDQSEILAGRRALVTGGTKDPASTPCPIHQGDDHGT